MFITVEATAVTSQPVYIGKRGKSDTRFRVRCAAMAAEKSDEELMLAYACGDMRAFDALYARQRGMLYRFILRSVSNRAVADEMFQETWSRAIAARTRYRSDAKFSTWLLQIAQNLMIDAARRFRPQAGAEETEQIMRELDAPEDDRPEHVLSDFEQRRRLQLALDTLPEEQREAFLLRMEGGLGLDEIARITDTVPETVKSRLRYAFAKIRARLAE